MLLEKQNGGNIYIIVALQKYVPNDSKLYIIQYITAKSLHYTFLFVTESLLNKIKIII